MYLMYADESGNTGMDLDNKQQPIFVLAALASNTKTGYCFPIQIIYPCAIKKEINSLILSFEYSFKIP